VVARTRPCHQETAFRGHRRIDHLPDPSDAIRELVELQMREHGFSHGIFVPDGLPYVHSRSIAGGFIYSALVIKLARYGGTYVSDTALTASCIVMAT